MEIDVHAFRSFMVMAFAMSAAALFLVLYYRKRAGEFAEAAAEADEEVCDAKESLGDLGKQLRLLASQTRETRELANRYRVDAAENRRKAADACKLAAIEQVNREQIQQENKDLRKYARDQQKALGDVHELAAGLQKECEKLRGQVEAATANARELSLSLAQAEATLRERLAEQHYLLEGCGTAGRLLMTAWDNGDVSRDQSYAWVDDHTSFATISTPCRERHTEACDAVAKSEQDAEESGLQIYPLHAEI